MTNLVDQAAREAVRLLAPDLGKPDGYPVPPAELRMAVSGWVSDEESYFTIGRSCASASAALLEKNGAALDACRAILDFGCGCGRVIRHHYPLPRFRLFRRRARLAGTDYNPHQIAWCRQHLPFADFRTNGRMPPLDYSAGQFDFVYSWAVFVHLTGEQQQAWMEEFARVLRPGGHLLISTNGQGYLNNADLPASARDQFAAGQLVVLHPEATESFETCHHCDAYHPVSYVKAELTRHFTWLDCVESEYGDYHLFRRPVS